MNKTIKAALLAGTILTGMALASPAQAGSCTAGANGANCTINTAGPDNTALDMTVDTGFTATFDTNNTTFSGDLAGTTDGVGGIDVPGSSITVIQNGQIGRTSGGTYNALATLAIGNNSTWDSNNTLNVNAVTLGTGSELFLGATSNSAGGDFLGTITGADASSVLHVDNGADVTFAGALNLLTFDMTDTSSVHSVVFDTNMGGANALQDVLIGSGNTLTLGAGTTTSAQGAGTANDTQQGEVVNAGTVSLNSTAVLTTHDFSNSASTSDVFMAVGSTLNVNGHLSNASGADINLFGTGSTAIVGGGVLNSGNITLGGSGSNLTINGILPATSMSINNTVIATSIFGDAGLENSGVIDIVNSNAVLNITVGELRNYSAGSITNSGDLDAGTLFNDGSFTAQNGSDNDFSNILNAGAFIANGNTTIDANNLTQTNANGSITLNGTSALTLGAAVGISAGTLTLGSGASVSSVANFTMGGGTNLIVDLASDTAGLITGNNVDIDDATISVTNGGGNTISDGDSFLIADATNAQIITQRQVGLFGGFRFDLVDGTFGTIGGDATQAYLLAFLAAVTGAQGGNNQEVQNIINEIIGSNDPQIQQIIANLQGASSTDEYNRILESLLPTADGGDFVGALQVVGQTLDIAGDRLDLLTSDKISAAQLNNIKSAAGGDGQYSLFGPGVRFWSQVFGRIADQGKRSGVAGYDADSVGIAVGADTENIFDNAILGLALSYAHTNVSSDNANNTETDINSYQLTAYGNYEIDERSYLRGMAAYVYGNNDRTRKSVGAISDLNANAGFNSHTFALQGEVGRQYKFKKFTAATLTPSLLAKYTHYSAEDFTETGAGGANLLVDQDSVNKLEIGAGVDVAWVYQDKNGGVILPEVRVGVSYDLIGDDIDSSSQFAAGGSAFETDGLDSGRLTGNIGTGFTYQTTDNWDLSINYALELKGDYHAHSGLVRASYSF